MDLVLDRFLDEASKAGYGLDYSLESLDVLEKHLLAALPGADDPEMVIQ